ncbi:hypothetical protein [Luteolibacter soli]
MKPGLYGVACFVGFVGTVAAMFLQKVNGVEGAVVLCAPEMILPFLVVAVSAEGAWSERVGKVMYGNLVTIFGVFFPGAVLGMLLGAWLGG